LVEKGSLPRGDVQSEERRRCSAVGDAVIVCVDSADTPVISRPVLSHRAQGVPSSCMATPVFHQDLLSDIADKEAAEVEDLYADYYHGTPSSQQHDDDMMSILYGADNQSNTENQSIIEPLSSQQSSLDTGYQSTSLQMSGSTNGSAAFSDTVPLTVCSSVRSMSPPSTEDITGPRGHEERQQGVGEDGGGEVVKSMSLDFSSVGAMGGFL